MKFDVYKVNLTTCEEIYIGRHDKKTLKTFLRGYKKSKEDNMIYECENSSWIYYIKEVLNNGKN